MKHLCVLALGIACAGRALHGQVPPPSQHDSVVVTGTFDPVAVEELDRAVSRLPVRQNEILLNSWVDALRAEPSVDLQERAPNGVQTDISIRGGTFGQTLILLDGIRLDDAQTAHHDMDLPIPMQAIDHVEVLRGAGSALYGSDAIGGVVNVITRAPETSELLLRTAVGNFGVNEQSGMASWVEPRWSEQLTFSRDFSSGFEFDRDYRNLAFGSDSHVRSSWGDTELLGGYADKPFGANQFYGNFPSWEDTKTWFGAVKQQFGEKTEGVFAYRRHSDLFVLFRDDPEIYTNHHADESYDALLRRTDGWGALARIHYGAEFQHEAVQSTNLGDRSRTRGSGYASLDIRSLKRFSLSVGAREDLYATVNAQFNPNVAAGYWLSRRVRLRGGVSRAFRLPTFTDLYYQDPANLGNALLKPEHAWSSEAGLEWQIANGWRAEATLFERRDYDGIDYVRATSNAVWQATNFDRIRFRGAEGAVLRRIPWGELSLRYTALRGAQDATAGLQSKYAFNYPQQSGAMEYRTAIRQLLLRTRVGAEKRISRNPYGIWDIYAAWNQSRVRPFVQLTNLTSTHFQEIYGIDMPGFGVVGGVEIRAWK